MICCQTLKLLVQDYDCTVEFVRSHFLVKEGLRINGQGNSNPTLSIDKIDKSARRWKRADILIFNTGHWWTHGKTARGYVNSQLVFSVKYFTINVVLSSSFYISFHFFGTNIQFSGFIYSPGSVRRMVV